MIKAVVKKLIDLYLLPFKPGTKLFYYAKDVYFTSNSEHLFRAAKYIKKKGRMLTGAAIIDVGGADGSTSLYFAERFPEAVVYCLEPNVRMSSALREAARRQKRIRVREIALGSSRGEATLHITSNAVSSSIHELNVQEIERLHPAYQTWLKEEAAVEVKVSTLDDEFKDLSHILLIKLDTQGAELDILKGGAETLKRTQFVLAEMGNHEVYKGACQYHEVDEFLRNHSFRLVDIVVSYRAEDGVGEYDALYENKSLSTW